MRAIDLAERGARDPTAVGHKAANLARFAATFRVPPAFCLTTDVYEELNAALTPEGAAERGALRTCVAEGYERLAITIVADQPRVAVRSSATGEDGDDASFAGQHETILNVSGIDAVVEAVLECWRSVGNERVTAYRKEKGIDTPVQVAVLVQQMVDADMSAIAFGVDPVSGDDTVVVIDAAPGLGDKIAAGEITPDRYVVRKGDLFVTGPVHGALNDGQAREVAKLTMALERENEHPVDMECAFAKGVLYLLQCRPITTLASAFPVAWTHPDDAKVHWRRDDAHFAGPVPRLVSDYTKHGAAFGLRRRAEIIDQPFLVRFGSFSGRHYTAAMRRDPTGDLDTQQRGAVARMRAHARGEVRRWTAESLPELRTNYAWYEGRTAEAGTLARSALAEVWDEIWTRLNRIWVIHMFTVGAAFAAADELAETYERLVGGGTVEALRLTQGRAHSLQQLERDLAALRRVRASRDEAALAAALKTFLDTPHGNLGNTSEDLRAPVWRDDPRLLVAELDRRLKAPADDPQARHARLLAEGEAVAARAREALRDRPADLTLFEEVLAYAQVVAPLTEEHNYHLDRQVQAHVRRLVLAVGARMSTDGQLAAAEDIFFFHVDEIGAALRSDERLHERARGRAAEYSSWQRLRHPRTLGAPPPANAPVPRADLLLVTKQDDASLVKGVAASSGIRRGAVCIVRGTQDFDKLKAGDVLVCRSSNVSWVPLFNLAGAIVTDVGGSLSHAAVVAREFGVPAVVGCGVALTTLHDGEMVEVDGDRGIVRKLDPIA